MKNVTYGLFIDPPLQDEEEPSIVLSLEYFIYEKPSIKFFFFFSIFWDVLLYLIIVLKHNDSYLNVKSNL